jgi:beta-glucosidase
MYRAIKLVSSLGYPIIITENGVADKEDNIRTEYIAKYLYAVRKAMHDGYNVIGYYYWSLMDNFEWAFGYDMRFGLYEVDFDTQERRLREGSKTFIDIVKRHESEI